MNDRNKKLSKEGNFHTLKLVKDFITQCRDEVDANNGKIGYTMRSENLNTGDRVFYDVTVTRRFGKRNKKD